MSRSQASQPSERVAILGTSAPNRFRTTASVLTFLYKSNVIRKFEVEECSIHQNGEICMRFGTKFSVQLFCLKLQISEAASRYFQIIHVGCNELSISQYIVLNVCVQRRSRDGNKFGNIIRRWRGEAIIDCNADRRQFYIYLFKDGTDLINNDCYIKLSIDDRILDRICLLNNDYSAGILFEVSETPKCEIHKEPTVISIDQNINGNKSDEKSSEKESNKLGNDESENKYNNKGQICPKILVTGSCTNKSCTFRHNINASDHSNNKLGNDEQLWFNERIKIPEQSSKPDENETEDIDNLIFSDDEELKHNHVQVHPHIKIRKQNGKNNNSHNLGWKPAAYYSFKQSTNQTYNLDKTSHEIEKYVPWTYEIDNKQTNNNSDNDTMNSLLKFLGQSWLFCIEFVREKDIPERFVNAIRQMRNINPSNIQSMQTDYEARCPIPKIFTLNMNNGTGNTNSYYHPPFEYINSSRSPELRLKRHLHDLNYHGAHDVAFALEGCLHNFPPVFIPEDLIDKPTNNNEDLDKDPDIFFKCLFTEIKSHTSSNEDDQPKQDNFSTLMISNANNHGHSNKRNKKSVNNIDLVWQALQYCGKNEEYKMDRSIIIDDIENNNTKSSKQNVLPALELFFKSLDYASGNSRKLKQKKNGNTHADHVWIKRVSVHPLRLTFNICEEESTRMFRFKQYSPPIDFCRIEFMDQFGNRSMQKDHFRIGNVGRIRAYKILQFGLNIAGITYKFLFFGNKQVRDAKVWMKAELKKGFDANRVRADIARLSQERNIGKKMDRFHLFMSKGTPGSIYKDSEIEIINDIYAKDGKILTDGCSLILDSEIKKSFPNYVASMLVRIGGAKTQMMSASQALLEKLIREDSVNNNENERNLKPKIILTKSCVKFMTDTQKQLEIKKCSRALPCMLNREFMNHCLFHTICELQPHTVTLVNSEKLSSVNAFKLLPINKQIILNLLLKYQRKFTNQLEKMENICHRQSNILKDMKNRYGARSIYTRPTSQEEQRNLFDTLLFLSSRLKVEESFLNRLTQQSTTSNNNRYSNNNTNNKKRLNFKDISDLTAILKRLWGGLKSKFKIQLDWPSCRMAGIADFQYKLSEFEVFLKVKIPNYFDWNCTKCGKVAIKYWNENCTNNLCNAPHPIYHVHRGPVGLLKNPCLHPGSYRLFNGVYYKELDQMFDGEVLVFSASHKLCETSQVHKLSGGDLDGDDFLCVVQKDLLPLQNDIIQCMEYDADKPRMMSGYVDIGMCVKYWLNYQINDCVGLIAEMHESFSDLESGAGCTQCLHLAIAHSKAVDYAKTGVAAQIPKNVGIPSDHSLMKYPHHMGKHPSMSYKSNSIKGILYDNVRIPNKYWRDREFRKQYNLKHCNLSNHYNKKHLHHRQRRNNTNGNSSNNNDFDTLLNYKAQNPMQPTLTNREKLRERLNRGCQICGIHSFNNAHQMNAHKDDAIHKRNKQMARDKAMLQRIKNAKSVSNQSSNNKHLSQHSHPQSRRKLYQTQMERKYVLKETKRPTQTILPSIQPNPSLKYQSKNTPFLQFTKPSSRQSQSQSQSHNNKRHKYSGNKENVFVGAHAMPMHSEEKQKQTQSISPNIQNQINIINVNQTNNTNIQTNHNNTMKPNKRNNKSHSHSRSGVYGHWSIGDYALYKSRDKCVIKDILYDSFPPRVLILKMFQNTQIITDFAKLVPFTQNTAMNNNKNHKSEARLVSVSSINGGAKMISNPSPNRCYPYDFREQQIKESKDAAVGLGFDKATVEKEMQLFLGVVKVSGHSLDPLCFLNYLCDVNNEHESLQ